MSGARTRGPRPVSTQVDGGGVCLGSTVGPSLPAVQPQVLLLRGLVSRSLFDPLPPSRAEPNEDPVQGAVWGCPCRVRTWLYGSAFVFGRQEQSPPLPVHAPAISSPTQLRGEQAGHCRERTMRAVQRCRINRQPRIKVRGLIPAGASVLGAGTHSWRFCPCTALIWSPGDPGSF